MLATFEVNSLADPSSFSFTDSEVSLREAITRTQLLNDADSIRFAASLSGQTISLANGQLPILTSPVTIEAADATGVPLTNSITINAQGQSRIFQISGTVAKIDGRAAGFRLINGATIPGLLGLYGGGAIYAAGSVLTLTNCEFTNNRAAVTEGDPQNWGGAVRVDLGGTSSPVPGTNSLPTVTIDRCTFRNNCAAENGGELSLAA